MFSEEEAIKTVKNGYGKYQAWPKDYIDSRISRHVDCQDCDYEIPVTFDKAEKKDENNT